MLLVVRPETLKLVYPQAKEVRAPQEPENNCTIAPELVRLLPMLLNITVALVELAVNLYHTSSSGVPEAQPADIPLLAVAAHTVPEEFVVPIVNDIAPEHSSFEGGGAG